MSDIEALVIEREGYLRRGLKDRVAQVDAQLEQLGFAVTVDELVHEGIEVEAAVKAAPERAVKGRPRRSKPNSNGPSHRAGPGK